VEGSRIIAVARTGTSPVCTEISYSQEPPANIGDE